MCQVCFFAALISCSHSFGAQESLVRDFLEAAGNHDVSKVETLMPRMSLLSAEQQKLALDDLSGIGAYEIMGSRKEEDAVIVVLRYHQGSDIMTLSIPVRKQGQSWMIGDDFRVRRSLESGTFKRSN